jgi:predicted Fe-Mo cluster-binding NifX family protein
MKIAVTAIGNDLDARMGAHLEGCPYFVIVNPETEQFTSIENPDAQGCIGTDAQIGQLMAEEGVDTLLTDGCELKTIEALEADGLNVLVGCTGTVREVVEWFKAWGSWSPSLQNIGSASDEYVYPGARARRSEDGGSFDFSAERAASGPTALNEGRDPFVGAAFRPREYPTPKMAFAPSEVVGPDEGRERARPHVMFRSLSEIYQHVSREKTEQWFDWG